MLQKVIRYRYYIMFGAFLLWMLFFDSNNMFYRISIARDISDLKEMKSIHNKSLSELRRQRAELLGASAGIEKFAREKYRMKKDNEDLFILVELPPLKDW